VNAGPRMLGRVALIVVGLIAFGLIVNNSNSNKPASTITTEKQPPATPAVGAEIPDEYFNHVLDDAIGKCVRAVH
jgi:hypothetical protein